MPGKSKPRIIVVGGGLGGTIAAYELKETLKDRAEIRLVSDDARFSFVPSNPWVAGVASLFTSEFYRDVDRHLNEGGVLAQWLQGYEFDRPLLASIVRAALEVFPEATLYGTNGTDLILVASRKPGRLDAAPLFAAPALDARLASAGIASGADLERRRIMGPRSLAAFVAAVRGRMADLTVKPLVRDRALWTHRTDYQATQALAVVARQADLAILRYESVRDPEHGACAALLTPAAFARLRPKRQETWFIAAGRARVRCARDQRGGAAWEFSREQLL